MPAALAGLGVVNHADLLMNDQKVWTTGDKSERATIMCRRVVPLDPVDLHVHRLRCDAEDGLIKPDRRPDGGQRRGRSRSFAHHRFDRSPDTSLAWHCERHRGANEGAFRRDVDCQGVAR